MIFWVLRPIWSLVWLASVLAIFCLTASLSSAAESQPRWVTNEAGWFGEVAPCFGLSVSETARLWRRFQAAATSSGMTGPELRWFFTTLAIMTQHAQSTPADAATALQIFETSFIRGHLTTMDIRMLNVALPGARALMAQGFGATPERLESAANIGSGLPPSVAAAALGSQVAKLATAQGQGSAQCGYWSGSTPAPPPDSTKGGAPTKPLGTPEVEQYIRHYWV
jgi:tape measure domain-containing protein